TVVVSLAGAAKSGPNGVAILREPRHQVKSADRAACVSAKRINGVAEIDPLDVVVGPQVTGGIRRCDPVTRVNGDAGRGGFRFDRSTGRSDALRHERIFGVGI